MRAILGAGCLFALTLAAGCSCGDGTVPGGSDGGDAGRIVDSGPLPDGPLPDTFPPVDVGPLPDTGPIADAGVDAWVAECTAASDCDAVRGPAPCGTWTCTAAGVCQTMCAGCTTDVDGDGYGVGAGCAGADCDDADPLLGGNGTRACYTGTSGRGIGSCRDGVEVCAAGVLGGCSGQVVPGGEACNAADDDCDGSTDEALGTFACGTGACAATAMACSGGALGMCVAGTGASNDVVCDGIDDDCDGLVDEDCACLRVTTTGNDATGDGLATPFRSIQRAIMFAATTPAAPRIVCVAAGASCGASATYAGDVAMSNGISVYGRYESTGWTRCTSSTTVITPVAAAGVTFDATITSTTVLGGFRIDRATVATTSAVTVDGSTGVTLTDITINNTPAVSSSYGVNMINGAEATITRSTILGGAGTAESIGVRSVQSTPTITNNCFSLNAQGRCDQFCGTNPGIRARITPGTGDAFSVLLDRSPNALVETTAMCANDADHGAGLRIIGDATGTVVRANLFNSWGGAFDSHGIWMEDCAGAAPWIVDNELIAAAGDTTMTRVDGVRAIGDCHPVIDSNVRITGGAEGGTLGANGVYCGANAAGVASRCAVLGNLLIEGSAQGFPPTAVGVRCDDGGCLRIEDNVITGRGGIDSWGVYLGVSGTLVSGNWISGGCSTMSATGIYAEGSYARIEDNFVHGFDATRCAAGTSAMVRTSVAMQVVAFPGANEVDVHSNTFEASAGSGGCSAIGLWLQAMAGAAPGPHGVFRNDIFHAAGCAGGMNFVVREESAAADPRVFEHDDLDPTGGPVLYVDEGSTSLTTAAMVDTATGGSGTLSVDPLFVSFPSDLHLMAGSMCLGAGTPTGAPPDDYDGMARDPVTPDVGADER
jgi:hypothetical protein